MLCGMTTAAHLRRLGVTTGWPRRLVLLLVAVLAVFPALSLAAAAHGYDIGPAGSPAGHAHMHGAPEHVDDSDPHHHPQAMQQRADIAASVPRAIAPQDHVSYDGNCCDACQIAVGLPVTAAEPAPPSDGMSVVRLSDITPTGEAASAPTEPPRS